MKRQNHFPKHRYKIKWKVGAAPITPELFDTFDEAKRRGGELLGLYLHQLIADVWNQDGTRQIVSPPAFEEWCKSV